LHLVTKLFINEKLIFILIKVITTIQAQIQDFSILDKFAKFDVNLFLSSLYSRFFFRKNIYNKAINKNYKFEIENKIYKNKYT